MQIKVLKPMFFVEDPDKKYLSGDLLNMDNLEFKVTKKRLNEAAKKSLIEILEIGEKID